MTGLVRLFVSCLVVAFLASSCAKSSSDKSGSQQAQDRADSSAPAAGGTETTTKVKSDGTSSNKKGSSSRKAPDSASSTPKPTFSPFQSGDFQMTVEPKCVHRSGAVRVSFHTATEADIAYFATYYETRKDDPWGLSQADAQGNYVWTFMVAADAPYGEATVMAGGRHPERGGGSAGEVFRVAPEGDC